jgi:hypothetical protein
MTQERVEHKGYYEMLWDCAFCGTKGLLGKSQRRCPECGGPQDADKRYFPNDDQKKAATGHVYEGADAHCPSCQAPMSAKVKNCTQCGSPMDGSKGVVKQAALGTPEAAAAAAAKAKAAPGAKKKGRSWLIPALAAVAVLGIASFVVWFMFLRTKSGTVKIDKHRWEASIVIEAYGDQHRSDWHENVPYEAHSVICHRAERGSHKEEDGESCHTEKHDNGDGTFEEVEKCEKKYKSVPDYDDKCDYTVRDWGRIDEQTSKGVGTTVAYPATGLTADEPATMGAKREGARSQKLYVDFIGGSDPCDWSAGPNSAQETAWKNLKDGAQLQVQLRARSENVVCDSVIP